MSVPTDPPSHNPASALSDAARKGEPDGGVAPPLGAPPETPPAADPPRRWLSPRVRSVLRVLLATLALGWWTQRAMRRHFDAGPYTGPLYTYTANGDIGSPGLMDDTGRIVVPAGTWDELDPLVGPDGTSWVARESVSTLVVRFDGSLPQVEPFDRWVMFDGSGRRVWETPAPRVVSMRRYEQLDGYILEDNSSLGMLRVRVGGTERTRVPQQLVSVDGRVVLEADEISVDRGTPIATVRDHISAGTPRSDVPDRVLLWRDGRWLELARHARLWASPWVKSRYRGTGQERILTACLVSPEEGGTYQWGTVRDDLRWTLVNSDGQGIPDAPIANAPGSQAGDPPVFTGEEQVEGAWLAMGGTDTRAVLAGGLWGLQASDGRWVVEPRWTTVCGFVGGRVLGVDAQGRQSIVDVDGRVCLPPVAAEVAWWDRPWTGPGDPSTYLASVEHPVSAASSSAAGATIERRLGVLSAQGEWLLPPVYTEYSWERLEDGRQVLAGTSVDTGLIGVFLKDGTQLLAPAYRTVRAVGQDYLYIERGDTGVGSDAVPQAEPVRMLESSSGIWMAWGEGGRIVNMADIQAPPVDLRCELFAMVRGVGYLVVRDGKVGLVDLQGRDILPATHTRLAWHRSIHFLMASDAPEAVSALQTPLAAGESVFADMITRRDVVNGVEPLQYRLYDLRTRSWLPQTLSRVYDGIAIRLARDGMGLLQPDMQTLLDYRALGLPAPVTLLRMLNLEWSKWSLIAAPCGARYYFNFSPGTTGLFLSDGRVVVPAIGDRLHVIDARFIHFPVNGTSVLMDRGGRLVAPGGETTWAALGAPGFVPLQRAVPAAASAAGEAVEEGTATGEPAK